MSVNIDFKVMLEDVAPNCRVKALADRTPEPDVRSRRRHTRRTTACRQNPQRVFSLFYALLRHRGLTTMSPRLNLPKK